MSIITSDKKCRHSYTSGALSDVCAIKIIYLLTQYILVTTIITTVSDINKKNVN